ACDHRDRLHHRRLIRDFELNYGPRVGQPHARPFFLGAGPNHGSTRFDRARVALAALNRYGRSPCTFSTRQRSSFAPEPVAPAPSAFAAKNSSNMAAPTAVTAARAATSSSRRPTA